VVIVLITISFFLGRYTANPSGAQATDPCAEIFKMFEDLQHRPGTDDRIILRTQMHLIVDHPECYAADVVATAKTALEIPLLPGG